SEHRRAAQGRNAGEAGAGGPAVPEVTECGSHNIRSPNPTDDMPRRVILAAVLLALGCGQQRSHDPDVSLAVASPAVENSGEPAPSVAVTPRPEAGKPAAPPPVFAYPTDLAGQALPRVVTPAAPLMPPTERFGLTPKGRTPPARLLDPEPVVKTAYTPTPLML